MPNSFDSLATFKVDDRTYRYYRLDALSGQGVDLARLPFSLKILLENLLRNEDDVTVTKDDILGLAELGPEGDPQPRDRLPAEPGPAPGLHRRAGGRGPRRDARRHAADGGRPEEDQPAPAGRAGDRPLGPGRRGRDLARVRHQRRAGVQPEPRALRVPPLGPGRLPELPRRPARHRDRPPGQPRIPRPGRLQLVRRRGRRRRRRAPGLSRHAGRDRLAHDDDQRPGRAGLGRRRDRGRGRDARPAGLDAGPAGGRVQAHRPAPRRRHGDRPRPDRHRDAPPQGGGRQVRRVLRRRPGDPPARRPGDHRQHGPRIRRDLRDLPDRRRDAPLPRTLRPPEGPDPPGRGLRQGPGAVLHAPARPRPTTPTRSSSTWRPSSRAWPAPSGRRTGSR